MVYDKARELAKLLKDSDEYTAFRAARDKAMENDTTKALIKDYHQLQLKAQAAMVAGKKDEETLEKLRKIGDVLQLNADAANYLMTEYRLNTMLGDVYRILAEAIDANLDMLD